MRMIARFLLFLYTFVMPWAYSFDLGIPFGNIARISGLLAVAATAFMMLQERYAPKLDPIATCTLAYFLYLSGSYFWTLSTETTSGELRGIFQKMMVVWLISLHCDKASDLIKLMRCMVAGTSMLALLTLAAYRSTQVYADEQLRMAAAGQDPNDVAHFLSLGIPLAGYLAVQETSTLYRRLSLVVIAIHLFAILLTGSRGGLMATAAALTCCVILFYRRAQRKTILAIMMMSPLLLIAYRTIPLPTMTRLQSIPEQIGNGDLNQRKQIWMAGWEAFRAAPILGNGAGCFVEAAHTATGDTAHNTSLALLVNGGLAGFSLALAILIAAIRALQRLHGDLRIALWGALLVCLLSSLVATMEENRLAWFLLGLIALAQRVKARDAHCSTESNQTRAALMAQG